MSNKWCNYMIIISRVENNFTIFFMDSILIVIFIFTNLILLDETVQIITCIKYKLKFHKHDKIKD